jgi:hypothetical protein
VHDLTISLASYQLAGGNGILRHSYILKPMPIPSFIGVLKAEGGLLKEAISLFEKVLSLDPTHSTARKHLEQARMQGHHQKKSNNTSKNSG